MVEGVEAVERVLRVGGTTVLELHVPHWRWECACNRFAAAYFHAGFTNFLFGQGRGVSTAAPGLRGFWVSTPSHIFLWGAFPLFWMRGCGDGMGVSVICGAAIDALTLVS